MISASYFARVSALPLAQIIPGLLGREVAARLHRRPGGLPGLGIPSGHPFYDQPGLGGYTPWYPLRRVIRADLPDRSRISVRHLRVLRHRSRAIVYPASRESSGLSDWCQVPLFPHVCESHTLSTLSTVHSLWPETLDAPPATLWSSFISSLFTARVGARRTGRCDSVKRCTAGVSLRASSRGVSPRRTFPPLPSHPFCLSFLHSEAPTLSRSPTQADGFQNKYKTAAAAPPSTFPHWPAR